MAARGGPRGRGARRPGRDIRSSTEIAFRVAASPRIGFGHLVRAIHLAAALGVPARVSLRGTEVAAETARRIGASLVRGSPPEVIRRGLGLLVIDDPSRTAALPWLRTARRADVPVVSIHDLGLAPLASDLAIDGSLGARRVDGLGREAAALRLGPSYAILSPGIARLGRLRRRAAGPPRVVVGLGGGEQAAAGLRVARQLRTVLDHHPGLSRARVLLSLGLGLAGRAAPRNLPAGIDIVPPAAFRAALAEATVAVVAGGTTLYEACALGTPVVAVAVVPGQVPTIRRFVRAGLAAAMTRPPATAVGSEAWGRAAAGAAIALLADGPRRRELTRRSRLAIDGAGAARVAAAIEELLRTNERATIARHEKTRTTR